MGITLDLPLYKKCLRVQGRKVFRKILESLRLIVNGCLKTLHNEKLHNLGSSCGGGGGSSSSSSSSSSEIHGTNTIIVTNGKCVQNSDWET
jgi:hypothetical protein